MRPALVDQSAVVSASPSAAAAIVVGRAANGHARPGRSKRPESATATGKPAASTPPRPKHHPKQAARRPSGRQPREESVARPGGSG
jgi:hypothetical protein